MKTPFFNRTKIDLLSPTVKGTSIGAGIVYKDKEFVIHTRLSLKNSAFSTLTKPQKIFLTLVFLSITAGILNNLLITVSVLIAVLSTIYFLDVVFSLSVILKSLNRSPELSFTKEEISALTDSQFPIYSILCPLYREAKVLPQFVESISRLDWPKDKLEVLILLEEDDTETIQAVNEMSLPNYFSAVIIPNSQPKTKPKACNFGLQIARGEYIVIYDAEDIPEPDQLKKAYLGFNKVPKKVICLQAKLNYYNPQNNLLTRLFTAEYSLWFDVLLPGLQSMNTIIPLGGTSNHFRRSALVRLHGWDPFNVTEDCDLGVRLFRSGYQTAIIDSTTLEEANSRFRNWVRQRSRWIKGYIQTYLVHMRRPLVFFRDYGFHALVFQLSVGGKTSFLLINPILWLATLSYFVLYPIVGPTIEAMYPTAVFYMALSSLVFGNYVYFYVYMIGSAKRDQWSLMKYVFFIPLYWLAGSVASYLALYQLVRKPHYWEKTIHGFVLRPSDKNILSSIAPALPPVADEPRRVSAGVKGLRILIFNWRDTKHVWAGGAELYLHELAKRWVAAGNKVTLFSGNDRKSTRRDVIDGVEIIRRGGFYLVYFWAFLYYIFRFRGRYDIIIDSENGLPFFTPLYAKERVYLLIHHVHQGVFRKSLNPILYSIANFLEIRLMPFVYRKAAVFTVSPSSRKSIMEKSITKKEPEVIYNGVDVKYFRPGRKSPTPTVLYLGRIKTYKSLDVLILSAKKILTELPTAVFVIAGEGDVRESLMKMTEEQGLSKNFRFQGRVSEREKLKLYQRAWLLVNPSMVEGWGITTIEANACGTPVVASRVSGLVDSVSNPHTGFLVPYGDSDAFSQRILQLLTDHDLRKRMGLEAIRWSKKFDWKKSADECLGIFKQGQEGEKEK